MHVCVCMCVTEGRRKPLVYCIACSSPTCQCTFVLLLHKNLHSYAWKCQTWFERNSSKHSEFKTKLWLRFMVNWTQQHSNQEYKDIWKLWLLRIHAAAAAASYYNKFVLIGLGQGAIAQHLEGTQQTKKPILILTFPRFCTNIRVQWFFVFYAASTT